MRIIDFHGGRRPAEYLGDGVYAIFDGRGIWLHANDHEFPSDRVYLEPEVLQALNRFKEQAESEEVISQCLEEEETKRVRESEVL